ncbi:hypothetical protein AcW2_004712 [Taiwanofungus camphoratus]|nr:hypothetical protein AcW2_004712 [Antrodia cinnamomea]
MVLSTRIPYICITATSAKYGHRDLPSSTSSQLGRVSARQRLRAFNIVGGYLNKAMSSKNPEEALKAFISEDPDSQYTFESERDVPRSEICREGKDKGPKCITLQMHSTKMFAAMQGFFCALPSDPTRTHMECRRIPKS